MLAGILQHAIEKRIDLRVLDRVLKREQTERQKLSRLLRAAIRSGRRTNGSCRRVSARSVSGLSVKRLP